ncbi:hypothetical protein Esti_002315 [Eimeria stiedai]
MLMRLLDCEAHARVRSRLCVSPPAEPQISCSLLSSTESKEICFPGIRKRLGGPWQKASLPGEGPLMKKNRLELSIISHPSATPPKTHSCLAEPSSHESPSTEGERETAENDVTFESNSILQEYKADVYTAANRRPCQFHQERFHRRSLQNDSTSKWAFEMMLRQRAGGACRKTSKLEGNARIDLAQGASQLQGYEVYTHILFREAGTKTHSPYFHLFLSPPLAAARADVSANAHQMKSSNSNNRGEGEMWIIALSRQGLNFACLSTIHMNHVYLYNNSVIIAI